MEQELVCLPDPLGCFPIPRTAPLPTQSDEAYDEYILSNPALARAFQLQDPDGCFLCLAGSEED